jgi:7-cyano-7-deazaguanine synthase
MNLADFLETLPQTDKNVVTILSGGLDSTILTYALDDAYGPDKVHALTFNYNQKQYIEIERAIETCRYLEISHNILDLSVLGDICKPVSANIRNTDINMPMIEDILGDPQPKTYIPFRNLILLSFGLSYAESIGAEYVFTGLQATDQYGYWDTTQRFVNDLNRVAAHNRKTNITICSPFAGFTKKEELLLCRDIPYIRLESTLTCYNPNEEGESCGVCPSCSERIKAFMDAGMVDPVKYSRDIKWPQTQ